MAQAKILCDPVLVVGGGPVGLSTAIFLTSQGVPVVLVEKHPGSAPHPRAVGWTPRTMELFASVGLGDQIPQAEVSASKPRRVRVQTLAAEWTEEMAWTPGAAPPSKRFSPHTNARMAQDELEPLLRQRARELGADLRMSTQLLHLEQDTSGVTAEIRGADGTTSQLRASYVVAADGSRSPVREALGIRRSGRGTVAPVRSVLFRAALPPQLRTRVDEARRQAIVQFAVEQPDLRGLLGEYPDGRFIFMFQDDEERDEVTLQRGVRQAIGIADLSVEIVATGRWEVSGLIADRFSEGRVFLAGDAAHTLPPNRGGFGANTGIDDANNLAWKLAAVLSGRSAPELLDSYDAERRPIAWLRHDQIFARPDHAYAGGGTSIIFDDDAMEFGQLYRSSIVLAAGPELPAAQRPDQWRGQPGTRAPHLWLLRGEERISSLDLYQRGWLVLSEDERWFAAAAALGIDHVRIGIDVTASEAGSFAGAFGLSASGAVLVRPDGYIAWRSAELADHPEEELHAALRQAAVLASNAAVAPNA
ncbi:MAG: FAD-dependent monooxygenase [Myxococcales bacterium]